MDIPKLKNFDIDTDYSKLKSFSLIRYCLQANAKAWEEFVNRFFRFILLSAFRTSRSVGLKEAGDSINDLVQEVLLKLLANDFNQMKFLIRDTKDEDEERVQLISIKTKLELITRHVIIDHLRRIKSSKFPNAIDFLSSNYIAEREKILEKIEDSAEDILLGKERLELLLNSLNMYNEKDATLLKMRYLEELTLDEIAKREETSTVNIMKRLVRAKERLRNIISKSLPL